MIYKKDANFPYPLLTNTSTSYKNSNFALDVNLEENTTDYRFQIIYNIDSYFITKLLENGQAQLILVIQSKDNKFFNLNFGDKFKEIPKSRISVSKRTTIQLLLQSKEEITFKENYDLSPFYQEFKEGIIVPKNSILGFSNSVTFEGSSTKPLDLFEKRVNPNIKSDIKVELGSETIIINYKNEELQFNDSPISSTLNNPYVYMGLQKALYRFIVNNSKDGEAVYLDDIDHPTDSLDFKLYNLMRKKMIDELSLENIDEVIYTISNKILEKYTSAVRGLSS
jgi:hypothetical protein